MPTLVVSVHGERRTILPPLLGNPQRVCLKTLERELDAVLCTPTPTLAG